MINHESIVRRLVQQGHESEKVDYKRTIDISQKVSRAKLAKLVSAIANTDSEDLDDYGYVILGAEKRQLIGKMDTLKDPLDALSLEPGPVARCVVDA